MGRAKRKSNVIEKAEKRLSGLKAVDPTLDFGNGLSVALFESKVSSTRIMLDDYNQKMATLDDMLNTIEKNEKEVKTLSTRFLSAIAGHFGNDSSQYEQAGGKRSSERKKPTRAKSAKPKKTE
jgi:hypothetical protein